MEKKKIAVISLGCPKNHVDTELMVGFLKATGDVIFVDRVEDADIVIVNTCGFIRSAKEESIDEILTAVEEKKRNPEKKVVVAGCLYQRYREELKKELPEVDVFIGVDELEKSVEKILNKRFQPDKPFLYREILTLPHFAYLKISEGCSNNCSYCAIPIIRGPLRSRPADEIVEEAKLLAKKGIKELYVVAQDTTAYGFDRGEKDALVRLLKRLEKVKGIEWIRLMYTYPTHVSKDLIGLIAESEKIVNYIDVPFQHVSDKVLMSMGRKYSYSYIDELIDKLREKIPDVAIRSSFIVGFPTETEKDFEQLISFLKRKKLDWAGFFKYSREEGTSAYNLGDLPEDVKDSRLNFIEDVQYAIFEENSQKLVGKEFTLLVDAISQDMKGYVEARSYRSAYEIDGIVYLKGNFKPGEFVRGKIVGLASNVDLLAEPV
ncbi:30S ribosomal protein S12 methylthiotransferase RimO [Desulfurobacterium atlanticum]|uniref:Ribosomal protein uS12 methylthiotransferase RimO n=1 Tax=Desulfurobacterium atlanticum TaxID=240169 RepID=A0A238ZDI7_9BACT|nr:30S ribosomal protein S12 methylthiotransferase RimO [Desulfurobacterium atlanticum]SNR81576.1 SSU ribosomal protein S12P methylthiotransferase [Desulfurobacterium atlanticum]